MEAYHLQQIDRQEMQAQQAWLNQAVQATKGKKNPKPKFEHFNDFFDKQEAIDSVRKDFEPDYISEYESQRSKKRKAAEIFNQRLMEYKKKKGGD